MPDHAKEIVEQAKSQNYTHIVAAGGDGTVNEIGTALMGTGIAFGVISLGSGNGFCPSFGLFPNDDEGVETDIEKRNDEYRRGGDKRTLFPEREWVRL